MLHSRWNPKRRMRFQKWQVYSVPYIVIPSTVYFHTSSASLRLNCPGGLWPILFLKEIDTLSAGISQGSLLRLILWNSRYDWVLRGSMMWGKRVLSYVSDLLLFVQQRAYGKVADIATAKVADITVALCSWVKKSHWTGPKHSIFMLDVRVYHLMTISSSCRHSRRSV